MKAPVFARLYSQPVAVSAGKNGWLSNCFRTAAVGCIAKGLSMKLQAQQWSAAHLCELIIMKY